VAKWLKIDAKEFSIGFGKSLISYQNKKIKWLPNKKKGDYDDDRMSYHLRILPFGGFVLFDRPKMIEGKAVAGETFFKHHPFKRILVILAGPVGNILLGFVFFLLFFGQQIQIGENDKIQKVFEDSYAEEIGLIKGDTIVSVNGKGSFQIKDIKESLKEEEICITYIQKDITKEKCGNVEKGTDVIGVIMGHTIPGFMKESVILYGDLLKTYTISFSGIIMNLEITSMNGPVGIIDAVQQSVSEWNEFLIMLITINVALGVANLLFPLTITDGGRIVIDIIAWIRNKDKINTKYLDIASILIMLIIFATTTFFDIQRIAEKLGIF
jgi:regulator of sigma E protease